ncbi:hypothetical protein ABIF07_000272 [Bradyrhizobium elkanii]|uniref:helix-turn-helix domain-containing protein n=1 Tax=Bradyrhizobium elkanii TaxID=29448 RepID=UPI0035141F96
MITRFADFLDVHQSSPRFARAPSPGADLAALLAAYARVVGDGSRSKRRGGGAGLHKSLAVVLRDPRLKRELGSRRAELDLREATGRGRYRAWGVL